MAALITNDYMRESVERVAILDDIDEDTFANFAEWAYTGAYNMTGQPTNIFGLPTEEHTKTADAQNPSMQPAANLFTNSGSLKTTSLSNETLGGFSFDAPSVTTAPPGNVPSGGRLNRPCSSLFNPTNPPLFSPRSSAFGTSSTSAEPRGRKRLMRNTLESLQYPAAGFDHESFRKSLESQRPQQWPIKRVVEHAKLYVFAQRYLIKDLKPICLHKLHRDLLALKLDSHAIGNINDLLRYTYDNTSNQDDASKETGSALRYLVITFAACEAEEMLKNKEFKELTMQGGELVADFMQFMSKRLD